MGEGKIGRRFWFWILLLAAFMGGETGALAQNACMDCHHFVGGKEAEAVSLWQGSTHQIEGVDCATCHGGDPLVHLGDVEKLPPKAFRSKANAAMYDQPDFQAKPKGEALFELCAQCHEESVENYRSSIMGKAYLNQRGGPSCVRCHGAHYNTMPEIPEACESCHADVTGFDQIEVMTINEATIDQLFEIRSKLAVARVAGAESPIFPEELDSFEIGFITFGLLFFLLLGAFALYQILEKRG